MDRLWRVLSTTSPACAEAPIRMNTADASRSSSEILALQRCLHGLRVIGMTREAPAHGDD